jgi:V/A-type H+-transporting ATPase subunit E
MPETIEAFVAKLRQEGVQAGRDAAEQHLAKARQEADQVLAQARVQAAKIIADAQAQADSRLAKSKTDLELAARDIALRLREALSRALREVLAAGAKGPLTDADFLGKLLYDIVTQYVRANLEDKVTMKINVQPEMRERLTQWALLHLRDKPDLGNVSLDLKGTLTEAGFEYRADGANVEVTLSAVVESLSDLVNPALREVLERAMAEEKK